MSFEQKEGQGILFKNDKGGNEKRPDYTGSCLIRGTPEAALARAEDMRKKKIKSLKKSIEKLEWIVFVAPGNKDE